MRLINPFQRLIAFVTIASLALLAFPPTPVLAAATITVTTTADEISLNSLCSLREAIVAANTNKTYSDCIYPGGGPDDVIVLQSGATYELTRPGSSPTEGDLDIGDPLNPNTSGNLTIQTNGSANAMIDVQDSNRVIEVDGGDINLTLKNITLSNGYSIDRGAGIYFYGNGKLTVVHSLFFHNDSTATGSCGAAIYNNSLATIEITDSTFDSNTCTDLTADGGAVYKAGGGTLIINDTTFVNNSAPDMGGALRIEMPGGTATITNSTFANNTAGSRGGGIQVKDGTVTISFSTFSDNAANVAGNTNTGGAVQANGGIVSVIKSILANSTTNGSVGQDCDQITPGGVTLSNSLVENNSDCTGTMITSVDPKLAPVADNGGPTQTMALLAGSPAINADGVTCSLATDQRGTARPQGPACDLGAYEVVPDPTPPTLLSFTRQNPATSPTNANTLVFRATFSESVTQVNNPDFVVNGGTTATVTNVSAIGAATYDITVSGGDLASFNGIVGLDLSGSQSIQDLAGNPLLTGEPATDETYTLNNSLSNVDIYISSDHNGPYTVPSTLSLVQNYPGMVNGPVQVIDSQREKIFASQRAYYGNGYNELMGYPADQFTTEYWFPWYDQVYMQTWILVGNPSPTQKAYVNIYINGVQQVDQFGEVKTYAIPPGDRVTPQFPGIVDGPVRVVSVTGQNTPAPLPIFASERSLYGDSFNEVMGYPGNQFTTEYGFPWYDQVYMQSWVLVGNPSTTQNAYVDIYIGGVRQKDMDGNAMTYKIAPAQRITPQFPGIVAGPVQVVSVTGAGVSTPTPIFTSERSLYGTSFNEVMGYPSNEFTTEYYYTWYDNQGMRAWVLLGNPSTTQTAYVDIYIGGVRLPDILSGTVKTYAIPPGGSVTPQFNANTGPVRVVSVTGTGTTTPVDVFTSERSLYRTGFNELMGYPTNQLTSEYWFTWYDNIYMSSDILVGRP